MRMLHFTCIALLFSMPLVVFSQDTDVTKFLAWLNKKAAMECATQKGASLVAHCQTGESPNTPTKQGDWNDMCDAAYKTVTCDNLPSNMIPPGPDGTQLYKNFTICCEKCAGDNPGPDEAGKATACCAACPSPIDFFLFWAENSGPDCTNDTSLAKNCNDAAVGTADTFAGNSENAHYKPMCDKLAENVHCDGLTTDNLQKPPFTDFKDCCEKCNGSSYTTADEQMDCVAKKDCGAPPTTKPTPAPKTTSSETTEGGDSEGNSTDTSAPLLPPTAIWAKVIALTAMIAKLI